MSASSSVPTITWTNVDSSHLRAVAYCEQTHMLGIEFKSGAMFSYEDVPMDVYSGLVGASSVGQYFDRVIKKSGFYDYEAWHSKSGLENRLLHHK